MPLPLPEFPSLTQQRNRAKDLLAAWRRGDAAAVARVRAAHPQLAGGTQVAPRLQLSDAQLVIAREYGHATWPKLKTAIEGIVGTNHNEQVVRLVRCVAAGDVAGAQRLLARDARLARMDLAETNEHRALHLAVRRRDRAMVQVLMEAGADPGQGVYPVRDCSSPRVLARDRGYGEITAIFDAFAASRLRAAAVPAQTPAGFALLVAALRQGQDEEAVRLLDGRPQLARAADGDGNTAMHHAAASGRGALVAHLLAAGAPAQACNVAGLTALELALRSPGDAQRAAAIRAAVQTLRRLPGCSPSLAAAVALGDGETVRARAAAAPELLRPPQHGRCALLDLAVEHGQVAMVALLLELGCDPDDTHRLPNMANEVISAGRPLWLAARDRQPAIARLLLENGASVTAQVYGSGNALYQAYSARDQEMIALLRAHGARLDLATAVSEGDEADVERLLAGGDRPTVSILDFAICGGNPRVVRRLKALVPEWRAHSYRLLVAAMVLWRCAPFRHHRDFPHGNYLEIMRLLLEAGADANAPGRWGETALHRVSLAGLVWGQLLTSAEERVAFAELLLAHGARTEVRDRELQSTPLGWAARWGRLELVRLLLGRGASAELPDDEPWARPLAWAQGQGHHAVAELLREQRAE